MVWPGIPDFSEAVQNPRLCFEGTDLEVGETVLNRRGMPLVYSGAFACVYAVSVGGHTFAVRCFTREVKDQQARYDRLSEYLINVLPPSFVHFEYQKHGISLKGNWYPIVRMEWVEGESLSSFVESNLDDPDTLRRLAAQWRGGPAVNLRGLRIAHNDLQHGNVMVQPDGRIRLVDYDGMFLPEFRGQPSPELGHKNFQHPLRTAEDYDDHVDNFPSLVIYLSLLAIASDPGLWTHHNQDNLIFTRDDYANPRRSRLFGRLKKSPDQTVAKLAERLEECCALPVKDVPDLETILQGAPAGAAPASQGPRVPGRSGTRTRNPGRGGTRTRNPGRSGTRTRNPGRGGTRTNADRLPRPAGAEDRDVLVALYNSTGGPNWNNNENWLSAGTLGTWHGVTTDGAGRVTRLDLESNQLSGQIPPELGNLSKLELLDLHDNQLSGQIPLELGNLSNLKELYLLENQLSGQIPPELGNLSKLEILDLSGNELRGRIPPELGYLSNLEILNLRFNELSGQIPSELSNLSKLEILDLRSNGLRGRIPSEFGNLSNLEGLDLSMNELSGQIPPELGYLSNLKQLFLHDNQLRGRIPPELGYLPNLEELILFENRLSGQIPPELGYLSNLKDLRLHDNQLSGQIPPELGNLYNLDDLYLSENRLSGCVPPALRNVESNDFDYLGLPFCDEGFLHRVLSSLTE